MLRNAPRKQQHRHHLLCEKLLLSFHSISTSQHIPPTPREEQPLSSSQQAYALHRIRLHCERGGSLLQAKRLHASLLRAGLSSAKIFPKYLIRMYALCGSLQDAQQAFDDIQHPDVVSWTELVKAYARNGHFADAFRCFRRMLQSGTKPDIVLLSSLLHSAPLDLDQTKLLDGIVCAAGYAGDLMLGTSLVASYGRSGALKESKDVFARMINRDPAAWNAMIGSCVQNGANAEALKLFSAMKEQSVLPDAADYLIAIKACDDVADVKSLHAEISTRRMDSNADVAAALIEYYGQSGDVELAEKLFYSFGAGDAQCWTKILATYARAGYHNQVIRIFHEMQCRRLTPIFATFAAVLDACAGLGALTEGRLIHRRIVEVEKLPIAGTLARSLVNMYAKCGELDQAWEVFAGVSKRDLELWNTCIDAFAIHGLGHLVLQLFQLMQQDGSKPDQSTFSSILFVSCYVDLVEAGYSFFASMISEYCLIPTAENYAGMIDLLGRAGELDQARELISRSPHRFNSMLWTSLIIACRNRGDVDRGKEAAVEIFRLNPSLAEVYVVLSRIYDRTTKPEIARRIRLLMKERDLNPELARSWIEISGVVHSFTAGDRSHPQAEEIYSVLEKLEADHPVLQNAAAADLTMHDVDEETESSVHSEKLAVVFGLMNSRSDTNLVVFKSKRLCKQCHLFIALISKLAARNIVVRDASRFHRFTQSSCSCGDYW